jgi:hypothetical protein
MAVRRRTAQLLALKSGNRCAKPGCTNRLTEPATAYDAEAIIGQIAHIVSQSDDGPRADPLMPPEERDAVDNLLLLCREHHAVADAQENTYTLDEMRAWKQEHERFVDEQMAEAVGEISFRELELVADEVANTAVASGNGFTLTEVREKMGKNDLTDRISYEMSIGMLGADLVKDYVARRAAIAPDFPDRLRGGFVREYDRLRRENLSGDELFIALQRFAGGPGHDIKRRAAGLSVLVHLFRICEVFEP